MNRPFLRSPEFRRVWSWCLALLATYGGMMLLALEFQSRPRPSLEAAEPAPPPKKGSADHTPAVQDELYGDLVKRAARGLPAGERFPHASLMSEPDRVRGAVVRWEGVFLAEPVKREIDAVPLAAGEGAPDLSQAGEGVVLDPVSGTIVLVTFLEPGPRPTVHGRVIVDGAFWKVVTYRNRRGEAVSAPYLVAKSWTLAPREDSGPGLIPILMAVSGGLAIASIMIGAQASRRHSGTRPVDRG